METCDVLARPAQTDNRSIFQYEHNNEKGQDRRVTRSQIRGLLRTKSEQMDQPKVKKECDETIQKAAKHEGDPGQDYVLNNVIKVVYVSKKTPNHRVQVTTDLKNRKKNERFRAKKYICDICNNAFTLKQNVQTHIFAYHLANNKVQKGLKRFQCCVCETTFKKLSTAKKHYFFIHKGKSEKKVNECQYCAKIYPSGSLLKEHITTKHLHEKPFDCIHCGSKFGRKGGLRRHVMMVHENYTYNCPYDDCDHPGYKCSKALAAHIRSVHTKEQPYVCSICNRGFVRQNDLKVHEATHGLGGFACEYCGKTFSRRKEVERHMERSH